MIGVFFQVLLSSCKKRNTVVICDALNISASVGALTAACLRGFHTMGIVTDVPCHLADMGSVSWKQKLNLAVMRRFDSYLLLTEQMNEVVNLKKRPYIVLEGHADEAMALTDNVFEKKQKEKVCLYAGSIMEIYGIGQLVQGFLAADIPNAELHIYGDGDYADRLRALAEEHPTIRYFGIVPNREVVEAELVATLLVNPRPSHEEYTKYSFPSKNMEYMASGTPVLTTRLPGMPQDHQAFVYFIEREDAQGIKEALQNVLSLDARVLHAFGTEAKSFILREKSNVAQAGHVIDFLRTSFYIA
jgi:glycosyltransferase involved in cell wall biosynthesis